MVNQKTHIHWALKCKQTKEQGNKDCLWTHIFSFYKIIVSFFSVKIQTKQDQTVL